MAFRIFVVSYVANTSVKYIKNLTYIYTQCLFLYKHCVYVF